MSYWQSIEPIVLTMRADSGDSLYLHNTEAFVVLAISGILYDKKRKVSAAKNRELRRRVERGREAILFRVYERDPQLFGHSLTNHRAPFNPSDASVDTLGTSGRCPAV